MTKVPEEGSMLSRPQSRQQIKNKVFHPEQGTEDLQILLISQLLLYTESYSLTGIFFNKVHRNIQNFSTLEIQQRSSGVCGERRVGPKLISSIFGYT